VFVPDVMAPFVAIIARPFATCSAPVTTAALPGSLLSSGTIARGPDCVGPYVVSLCGGTMGEGCCGGAGCVCAGATGDACGAGTGAAGDTCGACPHAEVPAQAAAIARIQCNQCFEGLCGSCIAPTFPGSCGSSDDRLRSIRIRGGTALPLSARCDGAAP
jgi:hypothetical protein